MCTLPIIIVTIALLYHNNRMSPEEWEAARQSDAERGKIKDGQRWKMNVPGQS